MERALWLKEKRRLAEERMDTLFAPIYDEKWGAYINRTHQRFIRGFLSLLAPHSVILDAACGTGKYWAILLEQGHTVIGIDQSQVMLSRAKAKFPNVHVEKIGLQEIPYQETFDGIICMDAMENVFPEDWLLVLNNLHQALKAQGYLYFTVELADEKEIENAYLAGKQLGLPVVYGEWAHEGGYHYYPSIEQVKDWVQQAQLILIEEGKGDLTEGLEEDLIEELEGGGYYHFLVHKES